MSEAEWAAGLYDGEGCTMLTINKSRRNYPMMVASLSQSHEVVVVERFQRAVGYGRIRVHYRRQQPDVPIYRYSCTGWDVLNVLKVMWPYLSPPKRRQAAKVVRRFREEYQLLGLVKRGRYRKRGEVA